MFTQNFALGQKDIVRKDFFEGNWAQGHKCNTKRFNHTLFTNCIRKCFLLLKVQGSQ